MKETSGIHKLIQEEIKRTGASTIDEINMISRRVTEQQNNAPLDDFDGLSPRQMHFILDFLFLKNSLIKLNKNVPSAIAMQSGLLNLCVDLLRIIEAVGELKLTTKSFLPVSVVRELYDKKYFPDGYIERRGIKLIRETDFLTLRFCRILCELSKLTAKRKNNIRLTRKGKKIIANPVALLAEIFTAFCIRFNWAFFDGYESENTGRMGAGYSLWLLSKYGVKEKNASWYAEKYVKAFPQELNEFAPSPYSDISEVFKNCYTLRTFERGFNLFGLVNIKKVPKIPFGEEVFVKKTTLFDEFIIINL